MRFLSWFVFYIFFPIQPVLAQNSIEIKDAWISEAPPAVNILAGYFTIVNHADRPVDLITVQSPTFERIEFHLTKTEDGVAHMQEVEVITIPARSDFSFSPGAYHLMLFNPAKTPKSGDLIPLQLTFSDGIRIEIETEVKRGDHSGHHQH